MKGLKMLRLANRILWQDNYLVPDTIPPESFKSLKKSCHNLKNDLKKGMPVIIADDIYEYVCDSRSDSNGDVLLPDTVISPFPCCFVEFAQTRNSIPVQWGWYIRTAPIEDKKHPNIVSAFYTMPMYRDRKESRVSYPGPRAVLFLDKVGKIEKQLVDYAGADENNFWAFGFPLFVFEIMSCSNTKLVDAPEHAPSSKWCRRMKQPKIRYRTITIDPSKTTTHSASTGKGLPKGLHLARAHMREYKEDGPGMFGKGVYGKFLIPAHARGSAKHGIVRSTYKVKAPKLDEAVQ